MTSRRGIHSPPFRLEPSPTLPGSSGDEPSPFGAVAARFWYSCRFALAAFALLVGGRVAILAAENLAPEPDAPVITSSQQFWDVKNSGSDRVYPLRTEIGVHYYDPDWNLIWAEWSGLGTYLGTAGHALPIRSGQRIELVGFVRPSSEQVLWDRTTIRVLDEHFAPEPHVLIEPLADPAEFNLKPVVVEGLVAEQVDNDPTHVRLTLASSSRTITAYLRFEAQQPIPQLSGAFVRTRGVFSVKYDAASSASAFELWIARPEDITVLSWLASDSRFQRDRTPIEGLVGAASQALVRIEGTVHAQEPGKSLTVRDATGQVRLLTRQVEPMAAGEAVEAIGYPEVEGVESRLRDSLYRRLTAGRTAPANQNVPAAVARLRLTEQIRRLAPAEAERGYPVEIRGVVTWSAPGSPHIFVQDGSGGVRAILPEGLPPPRFSADVILTGVTESGDFAPVLRVHRLNYGAGHTLPAARHVTFEQAMTGADYAEWVEIGGYIRSVTPQPDGLVRLDLTTPGGELTARAPLAPPLADLVGARVQVRAVCDVVVNERRQLTRVRLWVPSAEFISVREAAPADLFSTPMRSIGQLLQFGSAQDLNHRVQVAGTVALHRPGVLLYVEEADDRLLVLSRQTDPLTPGDRVDVVGFPGHEHGRLIMRDAVFRRAGSGPAPTPMRLERLDSPDPGMDGRTVLIRGRLLGRAATSTGARLQLQHDGKIFEVVSGAHAIPPLDADSIVDVSGVYRVQLDEYRQPRGFVVETRSGADVRLVQQPPWWTLARMLWAGGALGTLALVASGWGVAVSRKNQQLRTAERELHRANNALEQRVQERTRDLQLEVAERQRSEDVLAQERKLLRALIDNLPVYLYVKNKSGRFVIANLPHARLLGAGSGLEVVGKTDFDLHPPEMARHYQEDDQRVLETGEPLIQHEEPCHLGGQAGWLSTTKVALRDARGEVVGLIGISQDITARKQAEAERERLQAQLLESSHRAGMAEVATGILHNVGNVLNSVNVSATLVVEHVRNSKVGHVSRLADLLQEHAGDLAAFITKDPRGAKVPAFLTSLGQELAAEQARLNEELAQLWKKIEHIKDIVAMQQSYATVSGVADLLDLTEIVEDALRMNASSLARHDIEVIRDYQARPVANTERHKIIQIMVNLLRNAKEACQSSDRPDKRVTIRIEQPPGLARISVIDNGVGIAAESLSRLFQHGFTTRKDGHGFGLHSGALAARELGGTLRAESAGPGQGATFTLEIPLNLPAAA